MSEHKPLTAEEFAGWEARLEGVADDYSEYMSWGTVKRFISSLRHYQSELATAKSAIETLVARHKEEIALRLSTSPQDIEAIVGEIEKLERYSCVHGGLEKDGMLLPREQVLALIRSHKGRECVWTQTEHLTRTSGCNETERPTYRDDYHAHYCPDCGGKVTLQTKENEK